MKICLIGDFSPGLDEGYKNVCHSLSGCLEDQQNTIECLNIKQIHLPSFWKALSDNEAQIFHLITQPTEASLLFSYLLKCRNPSVKIVLSALKPENFFRRGARSAFQQRLLRWSRIDLVIVQSQIAMDLFERNGLKVVCIPNGVDTNRFRPVCSEIKNHLRNKYSIETSMPLALHVRHLITQRNLMVLRCLPREGIRVVIVGGTYMGVDQRLLAMLTKAGVFVLLGYQPHIEELYQISDIYIFPVLVGDSLSMPLSVLEAMACNVSVITTPFPGLRQYFKEGNGINYLREGDSLPSLIEKISNSSVVPRTREMVSDFCWESVATQIYNCYTQLLYS